MVSLPLASSALPSMGTIRPSRSRPSWFRLVAAQAKPRFSGNYFLDTEFSKPGRHQPPELISIGITSEDDKDFYAVSNEFNQDTLPQWVQNNVIPRLGLPKEQWISKREIREKLDEYLADDPEPRFFAKGSREDWDLLCMLYGGLSNLPQKFSTTYTDVARLWERHCTRRMPPHPGNHHNALADAKWAKLIWQQVQAQRA